MPSDPKSSDTSIGTAVKALYRSDPDREWKRSERHRTEFAVTKRALFDYLPPHAARILDCGGGPGHYAIDLAGRGYRVTLFDLTPELLTLAQKKAAQAGVKIDRYEQGTATDLSRFQDDEFEAVLLMGPLYHLLDPNDRLQALREAYRVAKPGAPVFIAFISRYAGHRDAAAHYPENAYLHREMYNAIAQTGLLPPHADGRVGFVAYFTHPSEIDPLCKQAGFEIAAILGLEGVVSMVEEKINALHGDAWRYWVDVNYAIAQDPSILGGVEHILAVCVKPPWRSVLKEIALTLQQNHISFRVVGGTALALRELNVPVNDLDLEMAVEDVYQFEKIYQDSVLEPVLLRENENWRSYIGRFLINGVCVKVMGGLSQRIGKKWVPSYVEAETTLILDDVLLVVPELEEEVVSYIRRGRMERAAQALASCDAERFLNILRESVNLGVL